MRADDPATPTPSQIINNPKYHEADCRVQVYTKYMVYFTYYPRSCDVLYPRTTRRTPQHRCGRDLPGVQLERQWNSCWPSRGRGKWMVSF